MPRYPAVAYLFLVRSFAPHSKMDEIVKALKSPVWWFSACFVAILASLVAGYLKDWCSLGAASLSSRMRQRRRRQLRKDARLLRKLRKDRALLSAYGVSVVFNFVVTSTAILFAVIAPICIYFYHTHPEWDFLPQAAPRPMPGIIPFGAFFIAMFGVVSGFALPRKVRLYSRAMRKAMR